MPTPIGHSLWSASMYIFFRNRFDNIRQLEKDWLGIALCLIIGLSPDLDFVFFLFNHNPYTHRSISHSVSFAMFVVLIGGFVLKQKTTIKRPYLLCSFLLGGHILWDFFTKCDRIPYGTMFLWPFSNKYYQTPLIIFPGFSWMSWEELLSFDLIKQVIIEIIVFFPILFLAVFIKTKRNSGYEDNSNTA
jgi:membrane-bound metal-dependent hydrolase YbcI (DUF457 family)